MDILGQHRWTLLMLVVALTLLMASLAGAGR
jgi:hypothetical protein